MDRSGVTWTTSRREFFLRAGLGFGSLALSSLLAKDAAADVPEIDFEAVAPGPLHRVRDFPAEGERLTADQPVGMVHTLVNGTPIRVDGEMVPDGLAARPGRMLS